MELFHNFTILNPLKPIINHSGKTRQSNLEIYNLENLKYAAFMDRHTTRQNRFRQLITQTVDGRKADMAKRLGLEPSYISRLLYSFDKKGARKIGDNLREKIEKEFGLPIGWLDGLAPTTEVNGLNVGPPNALPSGIEVRIAKSDQDGLLSVTFWETKGTCGGGAMNRPTPNHGSLLKEESWFVQYDCKPTDCVVVWADGDSMADYICDGDMVFFNIAKRKPESGKVYLIQHPDGLRIKQLRREIDGTWVLENRNPDKRRFPDERIPPGQHELLNIVGELIYRQG